METPLTLRDSDLAALALLDRSTIAKHETLLPGLPAPAITVPKCGGHPRRNWPLADLLAWAESQTAGMSESRVRLALALRLA